MMKIRHGMTLLVFCCATGYLGAQGFFTATPRLFTPRDYSAPDPKEGDPAYFGSPAANGSPINLQTPQLTRLGIRDLRQTSSRLIATDRLYIDFKALDTAQFLANLYAANGSTLEGRATVTRGAGGNVRVSLLFPQAGNYTVWIFAKLASDQGSYPGVLNFSISAQGGISNQALEAQKIEAQARIKEQAWDPLGRFSPQEQKTILDAPINKAMVVYSVPLNEKHLSALALSSYAGLSGDGDPVPLLRLAPQGNTLYLGYNNHASEMRVLVLQRNLQQEMVLVQPGRRFEAMTVLPQGLAVVGSTMGKDSRSTVYLTAWGSEGGIIGDELFDTKVVGTHTYVQVGDQGFDDYASLVWTGSEIAYLSATYRKWPDNVVHQGDYLAFYNLAGRPRANAGWTWGVSHSFRPLMVAPTSPGAELWLATGGDAYPRGLAVRRVSPSTGNTMGPTTVPYKTSGEIGDNDAHHSMGGMTLTDQGAVLVFDGKEGLDNYEIFMVTVAKDGTSSTPLRLTNSSRVADRVPKIARFGANFFVIWAQEAGSTDSWAPMEKQRFVGAVVSPSGRLVAGPTDLKVSFRGRTELFNYPDGAVGWVSDTSGTDRLDIVYLPVF